MEYDIYNFVKKCSAMSLSEVFSTLNKECLMMDTIYNRKPTDKIKIYKDYIDDFLFVFNTSFKITPTMTGREGLKIMKPVIENLVLTGQLPNSALNIFE